MNSDLHPGCPGVTYKPTSFIPRLRGWMKARLRDLMIVADVMHEVQWSAPWDDCEPAQSSSVHRGLAHGGSQFPLIGLNRHNARPE
jgi:hypothetical protein